MYRVCGGQIERSVLSTVNSEIFARILFSRNALKDLFVMPKVRDLGMIYMYQQTTD